MDDQTKPGVVTWFYVYCGFMAVLYLLLVPLGMVLLVLDPADMDVDALEAQLTGWMLILISIPLFVAFILPGLVSRRSWVWVYNLVLICLGLTSCCFLPICIPLLIFWIRPEVRTYYAGPQG